MAPGPPAQVGINALELDLKAMPNLPGFSYPDFKEHHHKPQTWNLYNGQRVEQKQGLTHDKPKFVKSAKPPDNWRTGSLPDSSSRQVFKAGAAEREHQELPAWDALDRHVLRFYAFFKEAVAETNLEHFRVRKVIVLYYLEDDTCQVIEPRQDNSGIPQGTLIRRHRFPAPDGKYVKPEDLQIGVPLSIYGKSIQLTDCDDFTREYSLNHDYDQGPALVEEADPFNATRESMKVKQALQPRTYEKLYREVMLGGGHVNADMQQFLEHDRRVLRFFCVLEDLNTPQFERRPFTILFFLADDTVEIRENYPLNSGRDNFPIFFRRKKMLRGDVTVDGPQSQPRKRHEYMDAGDFHVGDHVSMGGFELYVYDADDFTRDYFKQNGQDLAPAQEVKLPERAVPRAQTPPYSGFGSWDDSMASVTHLVPKPPRKDFNKLYHNDGKILRYTARFANPKPEDVDRLFVVNYHMADDTVSIHEPPQRNLGIVTGKFLEKAVHLNQVTGQIFKPDDLQIGDNIKVLNHEFEILDHDHYTKKVIDGEGHRPFELGSVLEKIRESMRQQFPLVRDIFRRFDADRDGVITFEEFRRTLQKFGFLLQEHEILTIMQHFDKRGTGQVSYNDFCDTLLDEDYTQDMMKTKPELNEPHPSYAGRATVKKDERRETEAVRKAVREIGDVFYKNPRVSYKLIKEFQHMTHEHTVTCDQVHLGLQQLGHTFDVQDVHRCILFVMPDADLAAVPYVNLLKAIAASYHDVCRIR